MTNLELRFSDGTTKEYEFTSLEELSIFLTFVINGFVREDGKLFKGYKQFYDDAAGSVVVEMKTEKEIEEWIAEERRAQMAQIDPAFAQRIVPPFMRKETIH